MKQAPLWWRFYFLSVLLCLAISACSKQQGSLVVGITDGDTLKVLIEGKEVKVRLAEIDAPERGQPFGTRARQSLSELAFNKQARLVVHDRDRYGRTVAKVYVDGVDVNAELVRRGMAWVYPKYAKDPELFEIERQARTAGKGLWSQDHPIPPWEFRKPKR